MWLAISNQNEKVVLPGKHPRKELLKFCCRRHADKIYHDRDNKTFHVGYIIAGYWWNLYEMIPLEKEVKR